MTKVGNKLSAVLLVLMVAAFFFVFASTTTHAYTSGNYEYTITGGTALITEYKGSETIVDIPDYLNSYAVTGIDYMAFFNKTSIQYVTVPSSVTAIGDYAFCKCTSLKSITILGPVTKLGDDVFRECSNLTDVKLPDSLTTLGPRTFEYCTGLSSITIPDGVTIIGSGVFDHCTSLSSIALPESLEVIGDRTFRGCGFTKFEIPLGVTLIGQRAFYECKKLTSLSIPESVEDIYEEVVDACPGFSDIYYWGNENAWQQLLAYGSYRGIDPNNAVLRSAKVYYNHIPSDYHRVRFFGTVYLFNMPSDQIIKDGKKVMKPDNPYYYGAGCTFDGWYSDEACTSIYDFSSPVTTDMTIYAKVSAQINYNTNGHGTAPAAQKVRCGGKIPKPADPQADGWKFGGWYTDAECTIQYDFNQIVRGPLTLYAKWTENTTVESESPYNADAVSPLNPVRLADVEKVVFETKSENDQKGSTFSLLQAKGVPKSKSSIKLSWKKVKGAAKYVIYGNKCGKRNKYKKIKEISGTSYTQKKLKKGTYYKYLVVAVSGDKALAVSQTVHVATKGGTVGNNTAVKLSKTKVSMNKGESKTVKATLKTGRLKVKIHRKVAWASSNVSVAKVNKKGKISGVKKGTCYVYAYAQNGIFAKVKVKIK